MRVQRWVIIWSGPEGRGQSEPVRDEDEAREWQAKMQAWWPERRYAIESVWRDEEPVHDLGAPYRTQNRGS